MTFKHFDLNKDIIVNCHMGTKIVFFPLILEKEFDQNLLLQRDFYSEDNSRKIKIINESDQKIDIYDFQIFEKNGTLNCIEPEFGKMPGNFIDNRKFLGRGSAKKDRMFSFFNESLKTKNIIEFNEVSIYSFYFCFYCDYKEKVNYWIFQGNPEVYDVISALKNQDLKSWSVKAHKDKIKTGDKFILWLTGKNAGCYALGEVSSEIESFKDESDSKYYRNIENNVESEKVNISIESDFSESPFLVSQLKDIETFKNFKGGNQGTNFQATREQFDFFNNKLNTVSDQKFIQLLQKIGENEIYKFYGIIDEINQFIGAKANTDKITFGVLESKKRLALTIGQRYCLTIIEDKGQIGWGFISSKKLKNWNMDYQTNPLTYYNYSFNYDDIIDNKDDILNSSKFEYERTKNKSSFKQYNSNDFEKSVFDLEFRNEIFQIAFHSPNTIKNEKNMQQPLNQILFGAPGTGKTYRLKKEYFNLFSEKINLDINKYFTELANELTWWEVISVVLLLNNNIKVKDIAAHPLLKEKALLSKNNNVNQMIWAMLQRRTKDECEFVKFEKREFPQIFNKNKDSIWNIDEKMVENEVSELFEIYLKIKNYKSEQKEIKRYVFTTFHQSMSYEDFIEGIKPVKNLDSDSNEISYEIVDGLFKQICFRAVNDPTNKYAIFIDEINRGNVSAIFGELITLIEDDKRLGAENEIKVTLPYSKKEFGVPPNLYIIGTMNTADRSVEALDTALRRRFSFTEMQPDSSVLIDSNYQDIDLKRLLDTINQRIEILIDKNHQIGHAYFINIESLEDLRHAFKNKIIPLLEEYFYGDYGKIGLVLGSKFIIEDTVKTQFADFNYEDKELLRDKKIWKFTNAEDWTLSSFTSIYG